MTFIIFILFIYLLINLRYREEEVTSLSHYDTTIVNGIFVILIFMSHSTQYFVLSAADKGYLAFQEFHNQWIVTTFLAFSGYGCMFKIIGEGGRLYIKEYPKKRFLKTLLNFDLAVLIYIVMNILVGDVYSKREIIGSFIGITSVGNSNWYMFAILVMYAFTYISAKLFYNNYLKIVLAVFLGAFLYVILLHIIGFPSWYQSTVLCYPFGMTLMLYQKKILHLFSKKKVLCFFVILSAISITYKFRYNDLIMNISSCFFVLFIVWMMCQMKIQNAFFEFIGKHAFSIYILQRIPMRIIFGGSKSQFVGSQAYIRVIGCFVITVLIAIIFDLGVTKFDSILIKKIQHQNVSKSISKVLKE